MSILHCLFTFSVFFSAGSPETSGKECGSTCDCQNGGTCDPLTGHCRCPPGVHGKTCEDGCPKGAFGSGRSAQCQCVEENTLECSAKNDSCTCKSGYQGNRCQKAAEYSILENASEIPTVKENELKVLSSFLSLFLFYEPALPASGDQSASSPVDLVRMEVSATKKTGNCDSPPGFVGKACTVPVRCISLTNLVLSRRSSLMKYQQNVSSHREVRQRGDTEEVTGLSKSYCANSVLK
ncbi:hypothetical protein HPG69_007030 [Diceros bicornis minor]|uniref:EGF-like domain-containing protein n=1 Tax=Diceros bicornis minor TaxID=77932 RepID=A0A7J7F2Y5_DICBM|nr:hypothetical protein HPG69_007030 [Diceros bicornis minor]